MRSCTNHFCFPFSVCFLSTPLSNPVLPMETPSLRGEDWSGLCSEESHACQGREGFRRVPSLPPRAWCHRTGSYLKAGLAGLCGEAPGPPPYPLGVCEACRERCGWWAAEYSASQQFPQNIFMQKCNSATEIVEAVDFKIVQGNLNIWHIHLPTRNAENLLASFPELLAETGWKRPLVSQFRIWTFQLLATLDKGEKHFGQELHCRVGRLRHRNWLKDFSEILLHFDSKFCNLSIDPHSFYIPY